MAELMTRTMTLPEGNYKVVSFALDMTGNKLIDEIFYIGAFSHPDKGFSQYIMPHRDVSQNATQVHGIQVKNFGWFRVLKDIRSMKTLRTKSEYSTLNEFIEWLKKAGKETDGIILAYHDNSLNNVVPFLMEALRRYKLTDHFFSVVKAFVNCHTVAKGQVERKVHRSVTLKGLLRKVLEYDEDRLSTNSLESARKRAQLIYQVMAKIFKIEGEIPSDLVKNYVTGMDQELANLEKQIILAYKVKTLRPIFVDQIRKGTKERIRACYLRRHLIETETEYDILQSVYKTGFRDGIVKLVGSVEGKKKKQDLEHLVDLIMRHFSGEIVKSDVNDNKIITKKEIGGGDADQSTKACASCSDMNEDEYEEAKDICVVRPHGLSSLDNLILDGPSELRSQLPPPYIPPKKKQLSAPSSPVKPVTPATPSSSSVSSVSFTLEKGFEAPTSVELIRKLPIKVHRREEPIFAPRSLFDRPSSALAKLRRDYPLGPGSITFPVVQPVSAKAAAPPPPIAHPEIVWMITEDYTILQSMTSLLELPLSLMVVNLAQTPNWDMTSQIVNLGSRSYRSQKQCRLRYENVIEPREEGKLLFEPQLKKKKAKTFIKISPPSPQRAASLLKTSQLLAQDNYSEFSKVLMGRFDSIKAISAKRNPVSKPMTLNPHMKSNKQSLIFIEHGINFDVPVPAITIAQARYERLLLERRKLMAAQEAARAHAIACVAAGGLVSGSNMIPTVGLPMPVQQVVSGNVTPPNGSIVSVCGTPVTGISPILSLSPGISATSASEAVAAQKARLAAAASSNLSMENSLSSSPGTGIQSQMQNLSTPTGNLLPLVLSPTTSSAITELIGRGVLTAGAVPTTNSPPKRQYTLQHHHSQLQQQLQLLQHHQMQQKQQQIQLAISQVPQSPNQQIRQQQITSLSPATIVTTNSASTSQPLVQLIQTTPTQRGPTKQVFITQTPQSQSQTVQLPQQQQIQLQNHQIQIQQHIQQVHAQQQKQMQAQQQPQTQTMVVPSMSQDYTVVTSGVTGESFATTLTPQGMTTVTRLQPSLLQPIPRTITSLADLVSGGSHKTPISVSSAMSSGSIVSQNLPTQFSITPNTTMPAMIPRPVLGQGQPITTSPSVSKPSLSTKPVRQPTPAGTSINLPMVSSALLMQQQQQRERPAMQQLKRYQVITTGQSNVQGGMNILCASTNASSPTSLTFLTTPMDPSNPTSTASTSQRVSIVPTSVVGSVGSIVTPSSTRLQLVKQQTVGGRTVTRAISDAEMAALFKHGLSPQTRVVTSTGQVQNQITTSSSPIQLTGSPLTPAAAQLVNLQDSQRIQHDDKEAYEIIFNLNNLSVSYRVLR